ncbi:MAG: TetR/AcrR family transcriptional regulator [Bacteroidales bacterium]|nr:TetR/AcrR family transcriptional regulator [Bacteroidales bacterium]
MVTKEILTRAALRLFRRNPYNDVSLSQIVKAVGVTKGSFYHHFRSKEEVFRAAVEMYFNDAFTENAESLCAVSLWEFCEKYVSAFWQDNEEYPTSSFGGDIFFMAEAFKNIPGFAAFHNEQLLKTIALWREAVSKAKLSGEIKTEIPDDDIARLFLSIEDSILLEAFITDAPTILSQTQMLSRYRTIYDMIKVR